MSEQVVALQVPKECECVKEHRPTMLEYNDHHIWPLGDGGPDHPSNRVPICPTTHANVHKIYRSFKAAGQVLPRQIGQPRYAYKLAVLGYTRFKEAQTR